MALNHYYPNTKVNKIVIGLTGPKGVGKSSVAAELALLYPRTTRMNFAMPIRQALLAMGIEEPAYDKKESKMFMDGTMSYRDLLISLGTTWGRRMITEKMWVNYAADKLEAIAPPTMGNVCGITGPTFTKDYDAHNSLDHLIVFDDVRMDNEADMIRGQLRDKSRGRIFEIYGPGGDDAYENSVTETKLSSDSDLTVHSYSTYGKNKDIVFSPELAAKKILKYLNLPFQA